MIPVFAFVLTTVCMTAAICGHQNQPLPIPRTRRRTLRDTT